VRLVLFDDYRPGLLVDDQVVDVSEVVEAGRSADGQALMERIIRDFATLAPDLGRQAASGLRRPLVSVRLRPPLPRPPKILCLIGNYREGVDRPPRAIDMFVKASSAVIGPGDTIELPEAPARVFQHEAELAVVIGRDARSVPRDAAMRHVFGYTTMVDVSARGLGREGAASFIGKSCATFAPLGPAIVTADEVADPHALGVHYWVNGALRQDYSTGDMEHRIPELIEWASASVGLQLGDVIACGTNHQGLGPLQDGDLGEIEIEGVGRMTMRVHDPYQRSWPREIDQEVARRLRGGP